MPLESHFLLRHDSFCHVIALLRSARVLSRSESASHLTRAKLPWNCFDHKTVQSMIAKVLDKFSGLTNSRMNLGNLCLRSYLSNMISFSNGTLCKYMI